MNNNIYYLENFLDINEAKKISDDIYSINKDWWYLSILPIDNNFTKKEFRNLPEIMDTDEFKDIIKYNESIYNNGTFCYRFYRDINNHYKSCDCGICTIKKLFNSDEIKNKIEKIINKKIKNYEITFVSKYEKDNFLTVHHDKGNGDYAFVYQLTPAWNPIHGGLLTFCNNNNVYKIISPEFNSFSMFKIKDEIITDHFVSRVTGPNARIAYTGWFSVEK